MTLGRVTKILAEQDNSKTVKENHFASTLILYYLSENGKLNYTTKKLDAIDEGTLAEAAITYLQEVGLIEKENDSYKLT